MFEIAVSLKVQGPKIRRKSCVKRYFPSYVEDYINQTLMKIRTEGDDTTLMYHRHSSLCQTSQEDVSLTISQDKSVFDGNQNNQSQFLSFSLTSVLEESTDKELSPSKRRHEHVKAASDLPPFHQK